MTDDFDRLTWERETYTEAEWASRFPGAADPTLRHPTQPPECIRTGAHVWYSPAAAAQALAKSLAAHGFVANVIAFSANGVECADCGVRR